jgi:hypothetical protein
MMPWLLQGIADLCSSPFYCLLADLAGVRSCLGDSSKQDDTKRDVASPLTSVLYMNPPFEATCEGMPYALFLGAVPVR